MIGDAAPKRPEWPKAARAVSGIGPSRQSRQGKPMRGAVIETPRDVPIAKPGEGRPGDVWANPTAARQALRAVAHTVHVVAIKLPRAGFFATTATAVTVVCIEPPTLAIFLNRSGPITEHIREGTLFSVSALTGNQVAIARACAGGVPHAERERHFEPTSENSVPIVAGAQAAFVCRRADAMARGTHMVIFGSILRVNSHELIEPLLYLDAQYGRFSAMANPETIASKGAS